MGKFNVTILGATGAVGREILKILEQRDFPIENLKLLASQRSKGKKLTFKGESIQTYALDHESAKYLFENSDITFGAASSEVSKEYIPYISGCSGVFIDNSSAFRLCENVPLVIPEINPEDVFRHKGIVSNPNCSTIITLVAIGEIKKRFGLKSLSVSTYQAVSGAGKGGIDELWENMRCQIQGMAFRPSVFTQPIACNLIPAIGDFLDNGYTKEEMKMQDESRKILHLPKLKVSCTCVRVPVVRSHSMSVTLEIEKNADIDEIREAIINSRGCLLFDDGKNNVYPTPMISSDKDEIYVGRVRRDPVTGGIALFCCGDQIRKGAATNAVQIAETLIRSRDIV